MENGDHHTDLSTESIFRLGKLQRQLKDSAENRKKRRQNYRTKRKNKAQDEQDRSYVLTGQKAPLGVPPIFTLKNLGWVLFSFAAVAFCLHGTLLGPEGFYQSLDSTDDLKDYGPVGSYLFIISGLVLSGSGSVALFAIAIIDLERINQHGHNWNYVINLWEDHLPILTCSVIATVILGLWAMAMMQTTKLSAIITIWVVFLTVLIFTILAGRQFFVAMIHNRKVRSK